MKTPYKKKILRKYKFETPPRQADGPNIKYSIERNIEDFLFNEELKGKIKLNPDGSPKMPVELDYQSILKNAPKPIPAPPEEIAKYKTAKKYRLNAENRKRKRVKPLENETAKTLIKNRFSNI